MIGKINNQNLTFGSAYLCTKNIATKDALRTGYLIKTGDREIGPRYTRFVFPMNEFKQTQEEINSASEKLNCDVFIKAQKDSSEISDRLILIGDIKDKSTQEKKTTVVVLGTELKDVVSQFGTSTMRAMLGLDEAENEKNKFTSDAKVFSAQVADENELFNYEDI